LWANLKGCELANRCCADRTELIATAQVGSIRVRRDGVLGLGLVGPLDEYSLVELRPDPDQGDQVRSIDIAPAFAGCLNELEHHRQPGRPLPWPLVILVRSLTVANVDSIVILSRGRWRGCMEAPDAR
jgi:hypothetical protein